MMDSTHAACIQTNIRTTCLSTTYLHAYMLTCLHAYLLTCLLACLRTYLPFTPAGTQAQILTHAHVFTLIY